MKQFLIDQYYYFPIWPLILAVVGLVMADLLKRWRWQVHLLTVLVMVALPFLADAHRRNAVLEGWGYGDGLVLILYLFVLAPCLVVYLLLAWALSRAA